MKTFLFLLLLLGNRCLGQTTFKNTGSGLNDVDRFIDPKDRISDDEYIPESTRNADNKGYLEATNLKDVTMDVTDSIVIFDNLPPRIIMVQIMDDRGSVVTSKSITHLRNWVNISRLPAGRFFLTLSYKDQQKGFKIERYPE